MFKYSVSIKKVSGRLNESVLPNKNLTVKSKTELNNKSVFNKASKYLMENYGLELESADITSENGSVFDKMRQAVESQPARSAWGRGVKTYALEMIDNLEEYNGGEVPSGTTEMMDWLLNGANDWKQSSEGGQWLVADEEIAQRLCGPSELKKVAGGRRQPNKRETWIDVQARALHQASNLLVKVAYPILGGGAGYKQKSFDTSKMSDNYGGGYNTPNTNAF
jgi:hypothetical protein